MQNVMNNPNTQLSQVYKQKLTGFDKKSRTVSKVDHAKNACMLKERFN